MAASHPTREGAGFPGGVSVNPLLSRKLCGLHGQTARKDILVSSSVHVYAQMFHFLHIMQVSGC